ncbi:proline-rich protein PRCC [Prorops nasuta]|uniref:proline-rich protein PRCC n=1 Tax=Prorops nasuta TaxID=863751 RepID=UPI0034CD8D2E
MSLVAYGSSDEGSEDEQTKEITKQINKVNVENSIEKDQKSSKKLCLPSPKHDIPDQGDETSFNLQTNNLNETTNKTLFAALPKPKNIIDNDNIIEDDDIPPNKEINLQPTRTVKKERAPAKITVPNLSEFEDVDENEKQSNRVKPSEKGSGLLSLLPPPNKSKIKNTSLVPNSLQKTQNKVNMLNSQPAPIRSEKLVNSNQSEKLQGKPNSMPAIAMPSTSNTLIANYDSTSEEEDNMDTSEKSNSDFFCLTSDNNINIDVGAIEKSYQDEINIVKTNSLEPVESSSNIRVNKILTSTVMNLPREEILIKNKAEVGPKLPVPEQEYHIDSEGNIAIDDKAIEYLCGKRGVKRKNKEIDEANIIEINGEDIKPDEREWLVKALTEEPVQRPISVNSGPSSQSKKKHQITYLAHQAKAMEVELKNQWAQNRATRQQTQSKYGF